MAGKHVEEVALSALTLLGVAGCYLLWELFYIWSQR